MNTEDQNTKRMNAEDDNDKTRFKVLYEQQGSVSAPNRCFQVNQNTRLQLHIPSQAPAAGILICMAVSSSVFLYLHLYSCIFICIRVSSSILLYLHLNRCIFICITVSSSVSPYLNLFPSRTGVC